MRGNLNNKHQDQIINLIEILTKKGWVKLINKVAHFILVTRGNIWSEI